MKKVLIVVVMMFLALPCIAFADHPLVTDEAETLEKGAYEFELNSEYAYNEEDEGGITIKETEIEIEAEFAYGIIENLEGFIEVPYATVKEESTLGDESESGLADIELGVRWKFLENEQISLAIKPFFILPTGDEEKGLGTGELSYGATLIATKEIGELELHANLGLTHYEYKDDLVADESRSDIFHISLAVASEISEQLTVVGNIGMDTNQDKNSDEHPVFLLGGVSYKLTENVNLSGGLKIGITEPAEDYALLIGLSFEKE
ncbi:MAG: transporter [Nitrospirota bacterium]|nr:MAG: transporter [Nitrospirota bacterium]